MSDEIRRPTVTEILEGMQTLKDEANRLAESASRLDTENRGWLQTWQNQQHEIDALKSANADLKAENAMLRARIEVLQVGSQS